MGDWEGVVRGEDRLLDVATVAERLATTVSHVRRLIKEGRLRHVFVGRYLRVPESAVRDFLDG